jgi:hypothetical protein
MSLGFKSIKRRKISALSFGSALCLILATSPLVSSASSSEAANDTGYDAGYQAALKLAQKKVAKQKQFNSQSGSALSTSLIRNLFGRMYQVGDSWDVASWSETNPMAMKSSDAESVAHRRGRTALFHYEVVSVQPAPNQQIVLRVTQVESQAVKKIDPRVTSLKLVFNDRMLQGRKTYEMVDSQGATRLIAVSPNDMHSAITPMEMFALDVPELVTADSRRAQAMPELPDALRALKSGSGLRFDASRALEFEQDDFFGRPVNAIWQQGDPWPAYLKTSNGISILISKGASS